MKYLVSILVLIQILSLAAIVVSPATASVETGSVLEIFVNLLDENGNPVKGEVTADFEAGGFEELEIIYGVEVDGHATFHYIAPLDPGEYSIEFLSDDSSALVEVEVFAPKFEGEEATAQVVDFGGSVAFKPAGEEVWKPIKKGQILSEGDSILALGDSYAVLKFPNDSETRVLENTQLEIVELKKVDDGYSIVLKQYSGKTFSIVKRLLRMGERFLIETKSVTAGVRGTKFAVIEEEKGFEIETFEGEVFAYLRDGRAFAVPAGKGLKPDGRIVPATHSEEEFEVETPKEETEKRGEAERENVSEGGTSGAEVRALPTSVFVGTVGEGTESYLVYSFGFGVDIGPLGLDIGITAYSTEVGGELYYGLPSTDPSTNLLDAFTINAFGLKFGSMGFRYGSGGVYTLGMGYTMRRYSTGYSKTLDVWYSSKGFELSLHLPYELRKISSLEVAQSDPLFFAEAGVKIFGLNFSVAGVYNSQVSTSTEFEPVDIAGIISARKDILGFLRIGGEVSVLHGVEGSLAYGMFGGIYGRLLIFDAVAGPYVNIGGFTPAVFSSVGIGGISKTKGISSGYMVGLEFEESWGEGRLYLEGNFDSSSPTLDGYLKAVLPRFGGFPVVELSGYIHDPTPLEGILDEDTNAWFAFTTLLEGGLLKAGTRFYWNGEEWRSEMFLVGGSM